VRHGLATPCACALITLAGCGAAGHSEPAPTRPQFIARADAICAFEQQKLRRAAVFERAPLVAFATNPRLIREAVAIRELVNAKLEALRKPKGEAARIATWLTARTVATTLAHDVAEAPVDEYPRATREVEEALSRARAAASALSRRYGFKICDTTE